MKDGLRRYGLLLLSGTECYSTNIDSYRSEDAICFSGLTLSDQAETDFSDRDNGGTQYIVISSWDNARWFVPNKKEIIFHVGNIIKPSSFKSRLVWNIATLFGHIGCFNKVFRTIVYLQTSCQGQLFLDNDDTEKDFIIYTGSRGLWQKFTIQEMKNNKILSFTKVGKYDLARQRIKNEGNILKELSNYDSIKNCVPKLIKLYERNGMTFLKQSPCPPQYNQIIGFFGKQHRCFLKKLSKLNQTVETKLFLSQLKEKIDNISSQNNVYTREKDLLNYAYDILCKEIEGQNTIVLYLSHGDFSQWNIFSDGDDLFVFDWEMGAFRCPLWDYFNFIYHKNLLVDNSKKKKLFDDLKNNLQWANSFSSHYERYHLVFLMEILIEYCHQNEKTMSLGLSTNGDQLINYFYKALNNYVQNRA